MEKYYEQRTKDLAKAGLYGLTRDQEDTIMEPSEAPENYHCDGEINATQAKARWLKKLKDAGLTADQIKRATKYVIG